MISFVCSSLFVCSCAMEHYFCMFLAQSLSCIVLKNNFALCHTSRGERECNNNGVVGGVT